MSQSSKDLIRLLFNDLVEAGIVPKTVTRFLFTINVESEFNQMIDKASDSQCATAINLIKQRMNS